MNPPKCKTCGKIEWRHVCRPTPEPRVVKITKPKPKLKLSRP